MDTRAPEGVGRGLELAVHQPQAAPQPYTIDDLPRFSPWPARLLGLEVWTQKRKTPQEVMREYGCEKWGPLLSQVEAAGPGVSLEQVDAWLLGHEPPVLCSVGHRFELLSPLDAHHRYRELIAGTLEPLLPASALVELGCGYGTMILAFAKRRGFCHTHLLAGEYTDSGIALVKRLAAAHGVTITVGRCDFRHPGITDLEIPKNAIIFSSSAITCVPRLSFDAVAALCAWQPRAVVHVEPCYEHCDSQTLLGLLRRRYIEVNDYNTNLMTVLREAEQRGVIEIIREQPAVFGTNPLLAVSVIVWKGRTT